MEREKILELAEKAKVQLLKKVPHLWAWIALGVVSVGLLVTLIILGAQA